jgi:hypothetical protein
MSCVCVLCVSGVCVCMCVFTIARMAHGLELFLISAEEHVCAENLCVCACVYMYTCVCMYVYIYIYIFTHTQ